MGVKNQINVTEKPKSIESKELTGFTGPRKIRHRSKGPKEAPSALQANKT